MKRHYRSRGGQREDDIYRRINFLVIQSPRTWQSVCAAVGLAGGLLAPLLGALLTVTAWFFTPGGSLLNALGTASFVLTIPLLALGAYCLDLLEKKAPTLTPRAEPQRGGSDPGISLRGRARGNGHHLNVIALLIGLSLPSVLPVTGHAQQTIFNVPTTDVLERGKAYGELDISVKPVEPRFSSFVPRVVVGVGSGVEVGLNVTGNVQPGADATTLVPSVKWKPYDGDNGWALVVGNNLFIPVRNRSYDLGNYAYAEISKTFGTQTRLTFGGYHYTRNVVAPDAQRAGGQFGFEQPITKKFAIQADWFTGKHANGYFTPGLSYKLSPKLTGYLGYSLGNADLRRGNHFVYAEVGFKFN